MAQNSVDTTDQTVLKYCTEEIKSAGGNDYSQNELSQAAAIKVTANQLKLYAGNYVVKMAVGLAKHEEWTPDSSDADLRSPPASLPGSWSSRLRYQRSHSQ